MVNSEEFAKRLEKILEFYDISAAGFAEAIEVGRSSISHILSGRNKPSLDFVMKVVQTYPEVELYWLLNGKGSFPPDSNKDHSDVSLTNVKKPLPSYRETAISSENKHNTSGFQPHSDKRIKKIVLLYEDGSFDAFEN